MKDPLVSVIMNCYNGEKYLKEAIDSVFAQTYLNWEIVFWDNQSTDNSAHIAKIYPNEKLKYFFADKHLTLGLARNEAIKKANGSYIAFLDVDDIWLPNKLTEQVMLFKKNNRLGLVYTDCFNYYSTGDKILCSVFFNYKRGNIFEDLLTSNFITLSTVVIPKRIIEEVGYFINFQIAEEYDLFIKIAQKYEIDYINSPLATYRYHLRNISKDLELTLKESIQILDFWRDLLGEKIQPIYNKSLSTLLYGLGRNALFQLKQKRIARNYFRTALEIRSNFYYYLFFLITFLPSQIIFLIRRIIISLIAVKNMEE